MQILRAGLGFTALQMFPEDKQDEISSFVFRVVTRGERSHRDVYLGTTGNFDKNSLLFRNGMGVLPDRPGQCQQACCATAVSPASWIIRDLKRFCFEQARQ